MPQIHTSSAPHILHSISTDLHITRCAHTAHPSKSLLHHPKALRPEVLSRVLARHLCCLGREEHPFSNEDVAGVKGSRAVGRHSVLHAWQKLCVCLSICPLGNLVPTHASLDHDQGRVSLSCSSPFLCNMSIPRSPRPYNQCPTTCSH